MDALQAAAARPPGPPGGAGDHVAAALRPRARPRGGVQLRRRPARGRSASGLYLVYPAFYTDVTDSYRLDRAGRVRTDLGGVYFNVLRWWGSPPPARDRLAAPGARDRPGPPRDGPAAAARSSGSTATSCSPTWSACPTCSPVCGPSSPACGPAAARPAGHRLRRSTRIVVTVWVLTVVPLLARADGPGAPRGPRTMLADVWDAEQREWQLLQIAVDHHLGPRPPSRALRWCCSPFPCSASPCWSATCSAAACRRVVRRLGRLSTTAIKRLERTVNGPDHPEAQAGGPGDNGNSSSSNGTGASVSVASRPHRSPLPARRVHPAPRRGPRHPSEREEPPVRRRTADDFTEEVMLRPRSRPPTRGWRRAVYAATAGTVNPGPGTAERREIEVLERVRTRVRGARRIVVLSRKGGRREDHHDADARPHVRRPPGRPRRGARRQPRRRQPRVPGARETTETVTSLLAERTTSTATQTCGPTPRSRPTPGSRSSPPTTTRGSRRRWASATTTGRSTCSTGTTT